MHYVPIEAPQDDSAESARIHSMDNFRLIANELNEIKSLRFYSHKVVPDKIANGDVFLFSYGALGDASAAGLYLRIFNAWRPLT